jgi:hypothetical protein
MTNLNGSIVHLEYLAIVTAFFLLIVIFSILSKRRKGKPTELVDIPKGQANIVIGHIEMYGSICKTEALELYGIKNLKAVIHVIRSKHKIEIESISQRGDNEFRGYAFKK